MTHLLALIVGFGSLAIYLVAFFFPEVHRKNDFYLSGLGLFYALVLWFFSPRIGGWFFLGQLAVVVLLFWFGLQTFSLRRQVTPSMQQTPVPSAEAVTSSVKTNSLQERVGGLFKTVSGILPGKKNKTTATATQPATASTTEDTAATIGKTLADAIDEQTPVSDAPVKIVDNTDKTTTETVSEAISTDTATTTEIPEATPPEAPPEELVEAAENADAEEKTIPPVEEIAPDAELAPPAEAPPEKIPPTDSPKE
ncbi:MAG: Ycf66 family protein [Rivularia sp. (in: Bacteria)]|nr:Ycf66 family protein [Rivularia sp. MS3]